MKVAVTPSATFSGVGCFADFDANRIRHCEVVDFESAIWNAWGTDAHFLGYCVVDENGDELDRWPRINKTALGAIRSEGHDVMTRYVSLDWDTPDHGAWSETPDATRSAFRQTLELAGKSDEMLGNWRCWYFTRAGARIVYELDSLVSVEDGESIVRALCLRARALGMSVDELADWTRLMRLPGVEREGKATWEEEYYEVEISPRKLSAENAPRSAKVRSNEYSPMSGVGLPEESRPDRDDAVGMLEKLNSRNQMVSTQFFKDARKMMVGRNPEFDAIFNGVALAPPEGPGRNTSMFAAVGRLAGMLMRPMEYMRPSHLYALMVQVVEQFDEDGDENAKPWDVVLWDHCQRIWLKESSQIEHETGKKESASERTGDEMASTAVNSFEWIDDAKYGNEGVLGDLRREGSEKELSVEEAVASVAIAMVHNLYYIMRPSGKYSAKGVSSQGLIAEIRLLGSESIIPLAYSNSEGIPKKRQARDIIEAHCITVSSIKRKFMEPREGGYIRGILSDNPSLWFCLDSRNPDVLPVFDQDVENWLRSLDPGGRLENWLSYAPAVEQGGICAIFLIGPRSIGKDMLVRGLSEVFVNDTVASSKDLTGDFNEALQRTCVLSINEDIAGKGRGSRDLDAAFRDLITSGRIIVNEKFKSIVEVYNSPRIIGTANNSRMLSDMFAQGASEIADRDAILERMMYIRTDPSGSNHLTKRGGWRFTGMPGRRWVASNNGDRSDYIVASHIMWLYGRRETKTGIPFANDRLLVEGTPMDNTENMRELSDILISHSESKSAVNEALLFMFETQVRRETDRGFKDPCYVDGERRLFWVTSGGVRDTLTRDSFKTIYPRIPGINEITSNLKSALAANSPKFVTILPNRAELGKVMWYCIDLEMLARFAAELGGSNAALLEFVKDTNNA